MTWTEFYIWLCGRCGYANQRQKRCRVPSSADYWRGYSHAMRDVRRHLNGK